MRTFKTKVIIFVLVVLFLSKVQAFALEDKIIAIVEDEIITERDAKDYLSTVYLQLSQQLEGKQLEEEMVRAEDEVVDGLIENKLIIHKGKEMGFEVKNSVIESRYQSMKTHFPSDEEFDLHLKMRGMTPADLKEKIADQTLMRYVVEYEVESKIFVHPQEVTDYYNDHLQDFEDAERLELDSIFIRVEDSETIAAVKLREIQKNLSEGVDFETLAKIYSDSPSLGTIRRGELNEKLEEIIFELDIGEISPPIRTNTGFYIFRLKDKDISGMLPLEEVKDEISQFLFEVKFQEKYIEWIEELKSEAHILIK